MTRIRAVLLDKDGTLTDFRPTWDAWLGRTLRALARESGTPARGLAEALGYDLPSARMREGGAFVTQSGRATTAALARAAGWPADRMGAWWGERSAGVREVPAGDVPAVLRSLRARGYVLGVLTNDERAPAEASLRALGALDAVDRLVASDDGHGEKPDPAGALAFAAAVGVDPGEILVVGDGYTDRDVARAAGMRFVAVLTGTRPAEAFADAEAVLPDIDALPGWLDRETGV